MKINLWQVHNITYHQRNGCSEHSRKYLNGIQIFVKLGRLDIKPQLTRKCSPKIYYICFVSFWFSGKALGAEFVSQDELLTESDFIILAVPLTNETRHMINRENLAKMKSNAIVVNVGRGGKI